MMTLVTASLREHPRERHLRTRRPCAAAIVPQHVDDGEPLLLVRPAGSRTSRGAPSSVAAVARELAGQKSAGQRAPDQQSEPLILQQRNHLALELAADQRVVRLRAPEALEPLLARDRQRLHQLPRGQVRAADVADLAGAHEIVERAQRVLDVRQRIEAMDLIEVDVVGAEPPQARFDRRRRCGGARGRPGSRLAPSARGPSWRARRRGAGRASALPSIVSDSPAE